MTRLEPGTHIHIVGIGGAGLSAIARILMERGCRVSGSDRSASPITAALASAGAQIYQGHSSLNIGAADLVLATSAVDDDHVELAAARQRSIPVYRRREFMPILLRDHDTVAIAGTHGKTTTTSMIIHILQSCGQDPSFIVGGIMGNSGKNAAVGANRTFVIEADEYDNMFHGLSPLVAALTTAEHDHPDFFASHADMLRSYQEFVASILPGGLLVACADDEAALAIARGHQRGGGAIASYAITNHAADWRAMDIDHSGGQTSFDLLRHGEAQAQVSLSVPGEHNILNALAAMAVTQELGIPPEASARALAAFKPSARRFEVRGSRDGVIVVDDYAHHPTEIAVNIAAARARYPRHAIWAIWQPHTFSRVRQFWREFITSFADADHVLVTPIYAAREAPMAGISSPALVAEMRRQFKADYAATFEDAVRHLRASAVAPAVALIFSAGDANRIADMFLGAGA